VTDWYYSPEEWSRFLPEDEQRVRNLRAQCDHVRGMSAVSSYNECNIRPLLEQIDPEPPAHVDNKAITITSILSGSGLGIGDRILQHQNRRLHGPSCSISTMFFCCRLNRVSNLNVSPIVYSHAKLDSHSDTCAFGDSAFVVQDTLQSASVSPFLRSLGSIAYVRIVTAAIAYNCPNTFTTFILHFPQSLHIPELENPLIASNTSSWNRCE
jgi:hypothetical protein